MNLDEFPDIFRATRYRGYRAFDYLGEPEMELAPEFARVPKFDLALTNEQQSRTVRLIDDNIVISLHEHPQRFPAEMSRLAEYSRTGRPYYAYAGLARSGLTAVFDNMMDGTGCITSKRGWSWDDVVYDLGMRRADLARQDYARIVYGLDDIRRAHADSAIGIVLALEAATPIGNEVDRLDVLYGLGVRQIGIAYSESNALGGGLKEPGDGGLTQLGRRAVERMNVLGLAIDVSHSADRTCRDVIEHSAGPVFITHAGARSVWPTPRMKPDDVLIACAARGGLIGIEAAPHTTLSREHPRHNIDSVMDHFRYCVDLVGIDHVVFGPDTLYGDHVGLHRQLGMNFASAPSVAGLPDVEPVPYVAGLENPTEAFYNIVGWLVRADYDDASIVKVIGGNILRVLDGIWH